MRKAEILRDRLIKNAEGMRKIHAAVDGDRAALPGAPGRAGEIAETVDRDHGGTLERRHQKARRKVRKMMLDRMDLPSESRAGQRRQLALDRSAPAAVAQPVEQQQRLRPRGQDVPQAARGVGARVAVDGHVRDIGRRDARFSQTISDRLRRKTGPVLDTAEALLLRGGNDATVADQAGR